MIEEKERARFEVGDRVFETESNEKATVSRLCSYGDAIYVRWDKDNTQVMVETKNFKKLD